jgi:hypothetical protein
VKLGNRNASGDGGVFVSGGQFHEGRICLRFWNWLAVFPQAVQMKHAILTMAASRSNVNPAIGFKQPNNISDLDLCTIASNETVVNLRELLEPA